MYDIYNNWEYDYRKFMKLVGGGIMHVTKLFIVCGILFSLFVPHVEASVGTGTASDKNYSMSYPIVYLNNNQEAQDKINSDLYYYIAAFKDDYYAGKFYQGEFTYRVKYEDDKYISIMLIGMVYNYGAAHTMDSAECVTYDKQTGEKLPLPYFVKLAPDDKGTILWMPIYDENDKMIPAKSSNIANYRKSSYAKISSNYYLQGNGDIALVYPPYTLAAYVYGFTHITIKSDMVDYFNRENQ